MAKITSRHFFEHRLGLIMLLLLTINSVFTSYTLRAEPYSESNQEVIVVDNNSHLEKEIDDLSRYINESSTTLQHVTGDVRDALKLQLFQKNEELRRRIAQAVDEKNIDIGKLIELVNTQQNYTDNANRYISERLDVLSSDIEKASNEEKLSYITKYRELQQYLDVIYSASLENIFWKNSLGGDTRLSEKRFIERVDERLRLLSASLEFLNHQVFLISNQIKLSQESEKVNLQVALLFYQQRQDIVSKSLHSIVGIADKLKMDTANYKRQIFQVTGNITKDLLNTQVVFSILRHWTNSLTNWLAGNAVQYLLQLFVFLLILLATKGGVKIIRSLVRTAVNAKHIRMSLLMKEFLIAISGQVVWIIGVLVGLSQIGLNLAPVLTGFGIAGVIVGFALQDTLANFAAGMMLLIYKPFDVGDLVHAGGVDGKVSHMSLVNTTIRTFDNQIIMVPNSKIWGDVIKNVTHERVRRVDMVFGIGYNDDLLKAEVVLTDIVNSHPAVLKTPEPTIKVHTLNTSSIDFIVRPWVKTDDYWDVYWDITKEVKLRFDREGISIPFPQQDVHLHLVDQKSDIISTSPTS